MKKILLLILIVSASGLIWYYFNDLQRDKMLSSGKTFLLINEVDETYAFSTQIDINNIGENFKIKGYLDDYTDDELWDIVKDLTDINIDEYASGVSYEIRLPEGLEAEKWNQVLDFLTPEQINLCDQQETPRSVQYCLSRHIVFLAMKGDYGVELCDSLFIPSHREECIEDVSGNLINKVSDEYNNNGLIDIFELDLPDPGPL